MRYLLIALLVVATRGPVLADVSAACKADALAEDPRDDTRGQKPLSVIFFETGSAHLTNALEADLATTAGDWLALHPRRLLIIEGHTDRAGSRRANLQLSQARADVVRDALVASGIDPLRIVVTAHGETRARADDPRCDRKVILRGSTHDYRELIDAQRRPRDNGASPRRD